MAVEMKALKQTGSIVIGILITLATVATVFYGHLRGPEKVEKIVFWDSPPAIRVCASSPADIHTVATGASWWRELGYEFDLIYTDNCHESIRYSTITIILDQGELIQNNLLGRTTFYSNDETNEIYWAIIELATPLVPRVLEHEMGHALGWMHLNKQGHMMHPRHHQGGWAADSLIGNNEHIIVY